MHKSALFAAVIFFILINASYAQKTGDVVITADRLSYSEDGSSVEASGSVKVVSPDTTIEADHVIYKVASKEVIADNGFTMQIGKNVRLSGKYLDYGFITKKGLSRDVNIAYRYSVMSGSLAYIDEERIELKNSSFNTCGLTPPHYHVTALTTTLYPDEGWVLGYYGYLWVDGIPLVPVPVYMYDLSAYGVGQRANASGVMSVPEMGSNNEDGFYVLYKVPWIANKKLTGRVVLLNTAKGGFGEGVESNYEMNDYNEINSRIYYDPRYKIYGGITHTCRFGPELGEKETSFYTFFRVKKRLLFNLITNVSYKERINFQSVSMLPKITLKLNDVPALFDHFYVGGQVSYGYVTEETTGVGDSTGNLYTTGYFSIPTNIGRIYAGLGYDQSWYGSTGYWSKLTQSLGLSRDLGYGFDAGVGHTHYINFDGFSPFLYEQYLVRPSDVFSCGLGYNFGPHRLSFDYYYYVPAWDPIQFIYKLTLGFHCYALDLTYNTASQQVAFGVSLIAR